MYGIRALDEPLLN